MGVAGLGAEDRADLEHTLEVTAYGHLLVQLRALRQAGLLLEVPGKKCVNKGEVQLSNAMRARERARTEV